MPQVVKKQFVSKGGEWVEVPIGGGEGGDEIVPQSGTPVGGIIAYGGSTAPEGWHLCDGSAHGSAELEAVLGSANAPDLRDRFVIAAGSSYPAASTGGAATHTLTTAELPSHRHEKDQKYGDAGTAYQDSITRAKISGGAIATASTYTGYTGDGAAHNNMPPYYALTYIIKTA